MGVFCLPYFKGYENIISPMVPRHQDWPWCVCRMETIHQVVDALVALRRNKEHIVALMHCAFP